MQITSTDNAIVNLPLAKRGNIDAQIDAYKRAERRASRLQASAAYAKRNAEKAEARELLAIHGDALAARVAIKTGHSKAAVLKKLDSMVKWESAKALGILKRAADEAAAANH